MIVRSLLIIGTTLLIAIGAVHAQADTESTFRADLSVDLSMDTSTHLHDGDFHGTSRALTGCSPNQIIAQEDFEDGSTTGWTNGHINEAPTFTKFLGRYGKGNEESFKTYTGIPKTAKEVVLEFDFYEIDNWNRSDKDYTCVFIDDKPVDLGAFDEHENEDGRRKKRKNGLKFSIESRGPPKKHRLWFFEGPDSSRASQDPEQVLRR